MRKSNGFSLIELMITVAIIGVLATIAIPSYQNYVAKARVTEIFAAMEAKKTIVEEYLTTTNDTICTGLQNRADLVIEPSQVIVQGGVGIPGPIGSGLGRCQITVYANAVTPGQGCSGETTGFVVALMPTLNTDGSITWACHYAVPFNGGNVLPAPYLPSNCTNPGSY